MAGYDLALPFDTDDPEFTRGVEIGMTWAWLSADVVRHAQILRASNMEMALRMAESRGFTLRTEDTADDDWVWAVFERPDP